MRAGTHPADGLRHPARGIDLSRQAQIKAGELRSNALAMAVPPAKPATAKP